MCNPLRPRCTSHGITERDNPATSLLLAADVPHDCCTISFSVGISASEALNQGPSISSGNRLPHLPCHRMSPRAMAASSAARSVAFSGVSVQLVAPVRNSYTRNAWDV